MFGSDKTYLTVSINDGVIKVAQASSNGSLDRVARGSFAPANGVEEGAKALKSLLVPFNRKASVICLIPANAATAKNIEVPSADPEEIKSIINLQASRHTPYSREEVLISYINQGLSVSNNSRLLLVIVHRDMVKERVSILEKAGLQADQIIFVPEAQARFYAKAMNLKRDGSAVGVIDFSLNATSYLVLCRGTLLFVRHIPVGIKAIMEGADAPAKLQDELKKSMEAYLQENGTPPPSSYLVTTAHEAVANILPNLANALTIELKVDAFTNFVKGSGDPLKKLQSSFGDDSFLDVIAPAWTADKCEISLMPDEMSLKKTVERQSQDAIKTGVAAVVIMVLIIAIALSKIYFKDTFLNKNLKEKFAAQKKQVLELQQKMSKIRVVRGYMKTRMTSLDIVHELYTITPNSIYLSSIAMDDQGAITIDGISESMSQVYGYKKSLDSSSLFEEADVKTTSPEKDNGKDAVAFQIQFKLHDSNSPTPKEQA